MDKRSVKMCCLAAVVASLAACAANKGRVRDAELVQLTHWLPGRYDNTAQAKADEQTGVRSPHESLELVIVPVESVALGRNAFYVQEMAADDPRRVMSQKVVMFSATDKGIVESVSSLAEPLRWRDGHRNPEVFMGMTARDLVATAGCELTWKKERRSESERFVAVNDPKRCRSTSHAVMGLVQVQSRAELTLDEFATSELAFGADGLLVQGRQDEPFYRFRKMGH
jgi:CpeT/CpcT family (DUF1001)